MINNSQQLQTESDESAATSDDSPCAPPEVEMIFAENKNLKDENENLRSQLDRALSFEQEIKDKQQNLYNENLSLKNKLIENEQNLAQLQERLKLSLQKNQDLEQQVLKAEKDLQKTNDEKKELVNQISSLSEENLNLTNRFQSIDKSEAEADDEEFLVTLSKMFEQAFANKEEAVDFLNGVKSEMNRLSEIERNANEIGIAHNDLKNVQAENQKLNKKVDKYKAAIQKLKKSMIENNKDNDEKIASFSSSQRQLEQEQSTLKLQNQDLLNEIDKYKDEINSLQIRIDELQQIRDREAKKQQQNSESKDKRISELKEILSNPLRIDSTEMQKLIDELSQKKCETEELYQKLTELKESDDLARRKLAKAISKLKKLKLENDQLKKQFGAISKKRTSNDERVSQIAVKNAELLQEIDRLQVENNNLNTQLKAAMASHAEGESAWNSKAQEVKRLQSSLNSLENMVERQRIELDSHHDERKRMVELIHKMNQVVLAYDSQLDDAYKKNKDLTVQLKRFNKQQQKFQDISDKLRCDPRLIDLLKDFTYDKFDEKMRFALIQILNDESSSPSEKLKNVLNALNKALKETEEKIANLTKENENLKSDKFSSVSGINRFNLLISSILAGFKKILSNDPTQQMKDFIALQTSKLEAALRDNDEVSTQNDILFNGTVEERRRNIEKLARTGLDSESALDLFTVQALTNIELFKQLERNRQLLNEQDDQISQIAEMIGTRDLSKVVSKLKSLKSEKKKLLKMKKKMGNAAYSGLGKKVENQNEAIISLQNDLRSVVSDATTLQNELDKKISQYNTLEKAYTQLMKESSDLQSKHLSEVSEFEKVIDTRNKEIRDLTIKLTKVTAESNEQIDRLKKTNDQLKELNEKRVSQFKKTLALLQEKKKNKEEQFTAKLKAAEVHHMEEVSKFQADIEQMKKELLNTTENNQKQTTEKDELNRRLATSLKKSEERNQKMTNELSKLAIANKTLEAQIKSTQDQMKREAQLLNTKYTFDTMANESSFQEKLNALKTKMLKERNDLVFLVLSELDELDDFDADDIDEDSFKSAIQRIGKEYRRQKMSSQSCL